MIANIQDGPQTTIALLLLQIVIELDRIADTQEEAHK